MSVDRVFDTLNNYLLHAIPNLESSESEGGIEAVEVESFVGDACKKSFPNSWVNIFTINDLIPEKITEFENFLKNRLVSAIIHDGNKQTEENFQKTSPNFSVQLLKPNKKIELDAYVRKRAEQTTAMRLKAFHGGTPLGELGKVYHNNRFNFVVTERDFIHYAQSAKEKKYSSSLEKNIDKIVLARGGTGKRQQLSNNFIQQQQSNKCDRRIAALKKFDRPTSQSIQIKFFCKTSELLNKAFDELEEADLESCSHLSTLLIDEATTLQEQKAEQAYQALLNEESLKEKATPKGKNKSKEGVAKLAKEPEQGKKSVASKSKSIKSNSVSPIQNHPPTALQSCIVQLNRFSPPQYTLHPRILRWNTSNLENIRRFEDFDPRTKERIKQYENYAMETLIELKNNHSLIGIEHLLSNPMIIENYSFSYKFKNTNEESKLGRGFYSVKIHDNKKETGIIYVGVGKDQVIYHAMFEPLADQELLPKNIAKVLETQEDGDLSIEEKKWDQIHLCTFSLSENSIIQMEIGKTAKQRITFQLYPIK